MEDLASALQNFLGSEEGAKQLDELTKMLGLSSDEQKSADDSPFSPDDILKLQKLMGNFNKENPNTNLLKSLKPLLKKERQKKVDEAVKIMKLVTLFPELKESGILNNLLG